MLTPAGPGGDLWSRPVVGNGSGDEFAKGAWVAVVGLAHRDEVTRALILEHDDGWISHSDQNEGEEQPPGPSVSVEKGRMHSKLLWTRSTLAGWRGSELT
jgi:hypothetical protein